MSGHWDVFGIGAEVEPGDSDVVQALQTEPQALGAGFTVARAAQVEQIAGGGLWVSVEKIRPSTCAP